MFIKNQADKVCALQQLRCCIIYVSVKNTSVIILKAFQLEGSSLACLGQLLNAWKVFAFVFKLEGHQDTKKKKTTLSETHIGDGMEALKTERRHECLKDNKIQ